MLACYIMTMFMSALLLFLVQPMVGKLVLPLFGGTPAVWNTCMVFFQAMLLAGYGYAHISVNALGSRRQLWLHMVVLLLPLAVLPVQLGSTAQSVPTDGAAWWLLCQLLVSVGLPFFVVSTHAPLLQRWFSRTGHRTAHDPYFLYAASNCGSLLALVGYPLLVEPWFDLSAQTQLWTVGYVLLILLVVCSGWCMWRRADAAAETAVGTTAAAPVVDELPAPTVRRRAYWVLCAFVPSSLMLGVTMHITTNLAAIPLLWVVPLAVYLLTFVLVFARRTIVSHALMRHIMPMVIIPLGALFSKSIRGLEWLIIPAHLMMFFVAAMVCHGELARTRPSSRHLTEFYLWMSVGGVLGGLFNALLAPVLFTRVVEYPLAMVLACLMLPTIRGGNGVRERMADVAWPALLAVGVVVLVQLVERVGGVAPSMMFGLLFAPTALACFSFKERRLRFALGFAVLLVTIAYQSDLDRGRSQYAARNFYGVKRVMLDPDGRLLKLYHGTTVHGSQVVSPERLLIPLTYYHPSGPIGDVFRVYDTMAAPPTIGVIGQGVGSIAYYVKPNQSLTFYEIDPQVDEIAQNKSFFTFMSTRRGEQAVVLGDGRLTVRAAADQHYGLMIIDAFSSDAIPVHLITAEAVRLYLDKLHNGGLLVFHISNRYLDLEPLLGNIAEVYGCAAAAREDLAVDEDLVQRGKTASHYVALSTDHTRIRQLCQVSGWRPARTDPGLRVWTDQYSNVLSVLKW